MDRPLFLITNDDGIHAAGIKHLWDAVHEFADVAIVAPLSEKSGSGVAITNFKPLRISQVFWEKNTPAWSVSGTPADCVKMALSVLLKRQPNLILSGINSCTNSGRTLFYSGTVGGAIEGALRGIPGLAFSFNDNYSEESVFPPVGSVKSHIVSLVRHFLEDPLPSGTLVNINFPSNCTKEIKGFKMAKQGRGYWVEKPDLRTQPEGIPYYWLGNRWSDHEEEPDSDVALLKEGYITAVPLHVADLTHHDLLQSRRSAFENLQKS